MKTKVNAFNWLFWIFTIAYSACLFYLFYNQCLLHEDYSYFSDMRAYILEIQGQESGYSFPYPIFFETARLLSFIMPVYIAIPIVLTVLNTLGVIVTYRYLVKQDISKNAAVLGCLMIFLVSMIYLAAPELPEGAYGQRYLGVFSPNPFQNATYIATRPFSILLFLKFIDIIKKYPKCELKDCIFFGIYMVLSVLAKPSFIFVIAPIFAVVFMIEWFKIKFKFTKCDYSILIGAVITIAILIWQYIMVFDVEAGGIQIGPGQAWHVWTPSIKGAIVKANLFPLFYLLCNIKKLKTDLLYRYSWIIYCVGILTFYIVYEGGYRFYDANFAWGYMHGLFFVFFSSIIILLKEWKKYGIKNKWYNWVGSVLLGWHLVCGIYFFIHMLFGGAASYF